MLIHAYRRRETCLVNLFDVDYVFAAHPDAPKAFVCEVEAPEAIERLLAISEGYIEYGAKPPVAAVKTLSASPQATPELTDAERELGFRLDGTGPIDQALVLPDDDGSDTLTPAQKAFAEQEAKRIADEEADELTATQERDKAVADAAAKEKADKEAAEQQRQAELEEARNKGLQDVPPVVPNPAFVLTAGKGAKAVTTDLNGMDDAALRAWAKEQGLTRLPSKAVGDDLRAAIVGKIAAA